MVASPSPTRATKDNGATTATKDEEQQAREDAPPSHPNHARRATLALVLISLFVILSLVVGGLVNLLIANDRKDPFVAIDENDYHDSASSLVEAKQQYLAVPSRATSSCEPSNGLCASTFEELVRFNSELQQPGETLAICGGGGGGTMIVMEDTLVLTQSGVTICCGDQDNGAEASRCILQSSGNWRNLIVRAANVTLRGLTFEGGSVVDGGDGGNVLVATPSRVSDSSYFQVSNCAFINGRADNGGNLHVQGASSVWITNSRFELGKAENGAGVSIRNTPNVSIEESYFDSNRCGNQGGGLRVYTTIPSSVGLYSVSLSRNSFTSNGAGRGAGFYLRNLGDYLRLRVTDSYFAENGAAVKGGVGYMFEEGGSSINAVLSGNIEEDNVNVRGTCPGLFSEPFPNSNSGSDCQSVNERIVYLPAGEELPPTMAPSEAAPIAAPTSSSTRAPFSIPPTMSPPVAAPIPTPASASTRPPFTSPPFTRPPVASPPDDNSSCQPSSGFCADNHGILFRILETLAPGDTVAICGTIYLEGTVTIAQSGVTVCCADDTSSTSRCGLQTGGGEGRSLIVRAANVTLRGLTFEGGSVVDGDGGNVLVATPSRVSDSSYFHVSNCAFINGRANNGGNLHVQGASSVWITNSRFELGKAENGAGVSIRNTPNVSIEESYFDSNRCGNQGGGLRVYTTIPSSVGLYSVSLFRNSFTSNGAGRGAGFYLRNLGDYLRLRVTDSYFAENGAAIQGGVGYMFEEGGSSINAVLSGNIEEDNVKVSGTCPGLFSEPFPNSDSGSDCQSVNERIVYLPKGEELI